MTTPALLTSLAMIAAPVSARQPEAPGGAAGDAAGGAAGGSPGADAPPIIHEVDRGWTVRIEPSYWYAAPRGDITLPGSVGPVEFDGSTFESGDESDLNGLDADNPTGAFLGRLHAVQGRWRFSFGAAIVSTTGDATAEAPGRIGDAFFATGDGIDTDFDFGSYEGSVSYVLFHGPRAEEPGDPDRFCYALELVGGARFESIDLDVRVRPGTGARPGELGLTAEGSEVFAQPIGGARLSLDLFRDFTIEVGFNVGYWSMSGQTSSTWDVLAAFSWRPVSNVGVQVGYRNLGVSGTSEDDGSDFEFRGSAAGLFAGIIVQF